jgi:glycosyltransferase involved in cell wall biosynthesis
MIFSIIIPSWNNLPYLKLCLDSIRKNSKSPHEVIVHVNDGSDGTLEWVREQGIRYTHTSKNVGICLAVNHLAAQASHDWVLYMNDDMYACPGWDTAFAEAVAAGDSDLALYFSMLIQPGFEKRNPNYIHRDFGSTPESFEESTLLSEFMLEKRDNVNGAASQPTLFHRKWWQIVGGYSLEFSPGMSSDMELLMKYWVVGCRSFKIISDSRFYHFSCKSTGRVRFNRGGRAFVMKWGMTEKEFYREYILKLGQSTSPEILHKFPHATLLGRLRRFGYGLFKDYPLEGIEAWDAAPGRTDWE